MNIEHIKLQLFFKRNRIELFVEEYQQIFETFGILAIGLLLAFLIDAFKLHL